MNGVRRNWNAIADVLAGLFIGACVILLIRELVVYTKDAGRSRGADKPIPVPAIERVQGVLTRPIPVDGRSLGAADNGLHAYEVTHERTGKTVVLLFMDTYYGAGLTTMELPPETPKEKNADE